MMVSSTRFVRSSHTPSRGGGRRKDTSREVNPVPFVVNNIYKYKSQVNHCLYISIYIYVCVCVVDGWNFTVK